MSQHITRKLYRNSSILKKYQRARFLYTCKSQTAISRNTPSYGEKLHAKNIKNSSFCRGSNTIKLIACKNKIVIPQQLQLYVVKWYHIYILHTRWYRTEEIILQHVYCPDIRNAFQEEFTECDICQRKKRSKKNGKLTA